MSINSEAIKILCAHLCVGEGVKPLEPMEWSALTRILHAKNLQPSDLLGLSFDNMRAVLQTDEQYVGRLIRLIDRSASLAFELSKYENMGINIVTRADADYPVRLKRALGNSCPPLFFYAGDLQLLNDECVGYVGSRNINECDENFTRKIITKTAGKGLGVVTGGAKGIDSVSESEGLRLGCSVVEFLSDSLMRRIKNGTTVQAIQNGLLLLLSVVKPDAGFNTGVAMMRNRYIYAQSVGTVAVKSDYNKGGTWAGAMENLKNKWCVEFCWDNKKYAGNQELIRRGAIPVTEDWNGNVLKYSACDNNSNLDSVQMSLFEE